MQRLHGGVLHVPPVPRASMAGLSVGKWQGAVTN